MLSGFVIQTIPDYMNIRIYNPLMYKDTVLIPNIIMLFRITNANIQPCRSTNPTRHIRHMSPVRYKWKPAK